MAEVALTGLEYIDDKGNRVSVAEGDKVDKVPADTLDEFRELGAIGEPAMTQADKDAEKDELLQQVADLQAELAAVKARQEAPASPNPPAAKTAVKAPAK